VPAQVQFEDAERPGVVIVVEADPQTAVAPGPGDSNAIVSCPNGSRHIVVGDYRVVKVKLQAAAAEGHESGTTPQPNTGVS